jgi:chromosome partitioning protein
MSIIVCPKCSRKHSVNPDKMPAARVVFARCKACSHRFPVQVEQLKLQQKAVQASSEPVKRKARKICITLSKGGVGKTTTSVNLSHGLALAGHKVLLVDTDTQGQSTYMLGKKAPAGLTELLTEELTAEEAICKARDNLWVLGGGRSLAGVKRIIDKKSYGAEWTLSEAMQSLEEQFDYIIIDTSPGWDQLTVNVLFYATEIMVPVALEIMPLHGLAEFMKSLHAIQRYRKEAVLSYIVPTFMDTRIEQPQQINAQLRELYGDKVCGAIRYDENFPKAPSYGKTIFEFAPSSRGADDYRELVKRVSNGGAVTRDRVTSPLARATRAKPTPQVVSKPQPQAGSKPQPNLASRTAPAESLASKPASGTTAAEKIAAVAGAAPDATATSGVVNGPRPGSALAAAIGAAQKA